ncbi:MAG: glutamyl-tRNA reductase [Candidatus Omnitrophica bacterium]|nr:glutamyl-tRNA reductase [Candidatus Omnitrophota bacterium]
MIKEFICVGLSYKTCPVEIREQVAFSQSKLPQALEEMRQLEGIRECFILSTCNRVELYGRGEDGIENSIGKFLAGFHGLEEKEIGCHRYVLRGPEVFRHLFRVASGLESMVVGENEIYGQLKQAFRIAWEKGTVDSILYQLVERALRVGKHTRTETKIGQGAVSVSSVAVELAEKIFGKLSGEQVLVLGTGGMSEKTLEHLVKEGAGKIVVTSRNYERTLELSQKFGAEPIHFDNWLRALKTSDIVISSTSAPHPIIRSEDVKMVMQERKHQPLFLIDIAVPRDIETSVQSIDDVYLYDIDDLQSVIQSNVRERKKEIEKCNRLIEHEIAQFTAWLEQLELKPVLQWLVRHFDEAIEDEIKKSHSHFQGRENQLRDLIVRVRKKFFHKPLQNLKHASLEGSLPRYLQLIRELFSEDVSKKRAEHPLTLPSPQQGEGWGEGEEKQVS